MDSVAWPRRRRATAFLLFLIVATGLAICAAIVPWADCPECRGEAGAWRSGLRAQGSDYPEWFLRCASCRDHGRLSLLARISREPVDPDVGCFGRIWWTGYWDEHRPAMERIFRKNGLDPASTFLSGAKPINWIDQGFMQSGSTYLFLLALSCNEGSFGSDHPTPFPGRMYLFDLQGRLVDSMEILDANGRAGVRFHLVCSDKKGDPPFEVRVFLRPELSKGPADFDLMHHQKTRRLLSGFKADADFHESRTLGRIYFRNGELEFTE